MMVGVFGGIYSVLKVGGLWAFPDGTCHAGRIRGLGLAFAMLGGWSLEERVSRDRCRHDGIRFGTVVDEDMGFESMYLDGMVKTHVYSTCRGCEAAW